MSGTSIRRAVLAAAIATSLVAATPALGTTLEGGGVDDPAIRAVVKIKGKERPFVRSIAISRVTYTCPDGSTFRAGFTVEFLKINDNGRFSFSGEADQGDASLKIAGKVKDNLKFVSGSFTEIRDAEGGGSCTSGKQRWEAKR